MNTKKCRNYHKQCQSEFTRKLMHDTSFLADPNTDGDDSLHNQELAVEAKGMLDDAQAQLLKTLKLKSFDLEVEESDMCDAQEQQVNMDDDRKKMPACLMANVSDCKCINTKKTNR